VNRLAIPPRPRLVSFDKITPALLVPEIATNEPPLSLASEGFE
jgi:hypothetical protein